MENKQSKHTREKLSIDDQIEHLCSNGVLFELEPKESAMEFLRHNNYFFKLKVYEHSFYKNGDKYTYLDFAYLKELSTLDSLFRKLIIKMCVDIEHYLKVKLVLDCTENETEDGYNIIDKLIKKHPDINDEICRNHSKYTNGLVSWININGKSLWSIIELISFHSFTKLLELYYKEYPDKIMTNILPCLYSVRMLRNAAAHNNCLFHTLSSNNSIRIVPTKYVTNMVSKIKTISANAREKKLSNAITHDFASLLIVYDLSISSPKSKEYVYKEMKEKFIVRLYKRIEYFSHNADVESSFEFMKKMVDFFANCAYTKEDEQKQ